MNITFRQGSETLSRKLVDRAQIKLAKLSKFFTAKNYEPLAYVDVERESGAQKSEKLWRASINLDLAGERYNATAQGSSADVAVDTAIRELKREVRRAREKQVSLRRRSPNLFQSLRNSFS